MAARSSNHPCALPSAHVERPTKTFFHIYQWMSCSASQLSLNPVQLGYPSMFLSSLCSFLRIEAHSQG